MMTKHWCKECFKAVVDDTANDKFILMYPKIQKCPSCGGMKQLVAEYFKYGEHTVTDDGLRIAENVKHIGVDPDFSYWKKEAPKDDNNNSDEISEGS